MPPDELERIRQDVLAALDFWVSKGLGRDLNNLQINVITYHEPGEQVRSLCMQDRQRVRVGRNAALLTGRSRVVT